MVFATTTNLASGGWRDFGMKSEQECRDLIGSMYKSVGVQKYSQTWYEKTDRCKDTVDRRGYVIGQPPPN